MKHYAKIRWLRWEQRHVLGGVETSGATKRCHAFLVGRDGKMARKSLCGLPWREKGCRIEKDPSVGRCNRCDAELRSGSLDPADQVPPEIPEPDPADYEPRFNLEDDEQ